MKKFSRSIAILFLIIILCATAVSAATTLIPGGQVIGLQLQDGTLTVTDFDETIGAAARNAGLQKGDRIVHINGEKVTCAEDVQKILSTCDDRVTMSIQRGDKIKKIKLQPAATADGPRLGVYLRQGTTGLGTVTYYDPATGEFAALGHGVNTPEGKLLTLNRGSIYDAQIFSVKKGKAGAPGQLLGTMTSPEVKGTLRQNTLQGVFGKANREFTGEALPVATCDEIHPGSATIRATVNGSALQEYSVEILKIYPKGDHRTRNLLLKITDPSLLDTTGGIVQGMSGSPIIQDGKLVGAVTHVLVNDPTMGYGIFIENMLDAAA